MKRLGFKPNYIRANRNINCNIKPNNLSLNGRRIKEGFDLAQRTQTNKIYVCVDKATQKFAIGYDDTNTDYSAPVLVKPLELSDRTQWLMSNADSGIMTFFYTPANHFKIDIEKDEEGRIIVQRSDKFENANFYYAATGEIYLKSVSDGQKSNLCLAFKKGDLQGATTSPAIQMDEWDKRYSYYKDSMRAEYTPRNESSESFKSNLRNSLNGKYYRKERFDSSTQAYLELIDLTSLSTEEKQLYSYQWTFFEVWDVRTATNLALEMEQIKDLQAIDQEIVADSEKAVEIANMQLAEVQDKYDRMVKKVQGYTLGRFWI